MKESCFYEIIFVDDGSFEYAWCKSVHSFFLKKEKDFNLHLMCVSVCSLYL